MYGIGYFSPSVNRVENIPVILLIAIIALFLSFLINWLYKTNRVKLALKLQASMGLGMLILLAFLMITPIILILFVLIMAYFNLHF